MTWMQKTAIFLVASGHLLWVRFRLWQAGPSWLESKLSPLNDASDMQSAQVHFQYAVQLYEIIRLAARCQYRQSACLPKSIVLYEMLQSKGYAVQLKIGVNKTAQRLYSHAWVEFDGKMISEPEQVAQQFTDLQGCDLQGEAHNKNKVAKPNTEK